MSNLSMTKKLAVIANLLEIGPPTIYRTVIDRGFDYDNYKPWMSYN